MVLCGMAKPHFVSILLPVLREQNQDRATVHSAGQLPWQGGAGADCLTPAQSLRGRLWHRAFEDVADGSGAHGCQPEGDGSVKVGFEAERDANRVSDNQTSKWGHSSSQANWLSPEQGEPMRFRR